MLYTINNKEIKGSTSQRICGLDLIRLCAIFFVIAGHFFICNTQYLSVTFKGTSMFIQAIMMSIFYVSVPLFIMLTGYLNINKVATKKYYIGMLRVLVAYLIFSIITILFRIYYLGEEFSVIQWTGKILRYSAIPYAWYIEMWIGLALLAPFLNYLWKAIPTIQQKLLLVATLFVLTSIPDFCNRYGYHIVPGYFAKGCYPLMFYFIGTFIREYQPTIKYWFGWIIILSISLVTPLYNTLMFNGDKIIYHIAGNPGGVFYTWIAVAIFLMLYRKDIEFPTVKKWITHCSMVSLEMYLCCYMFDQLYYPWFKEHYFVSQSQFLPWFFVIVPLVFFSSYIVATLYNSIRNLLKRNKQ